MSGDPHASLLPWLLLALGFPLASFLICFVIRPHVAWVSSIISSLLLVATLVFCLIIFVTRQAADTNFLVYQWKWFDLGTAPLNFSLLLDNYSLVMLLMVVSISTLVHIYSAGYMVHDEYQSRFFSLLGLFTFAMMGLVLSGNLLVLFCFWELVGVASYFLIGHWRSRISAARAASKAFLFNRIGDAAFITGLMLTWKINGSFDIQTITTGHVAWTMAPGLCFFIGAIAKSAQLPLMTWLPDAMEGPTPVSALIHAATMVAAGIFILVRLQSLYSPASLIFVAAIGSITALYSGWLAMKQTDLKKVLAYSTISQLGLMMIAIGMQAFDGAFLHLITHGFFKACLFLCAGALIHAIESSRRHGDTDAQDMRNMGGLRHSYPILFICFCLAGASLAGVPMLSGFMSKEAMLVGMVSNAIHWTSWIFIMAFMITSLFTAMYTYRMIKIVFLGPAKTSAMRPVAAVMQVPTLICAGLCLWFFYSSNPLDYTAWFQHLPHVLSESKLKVTIASIVWITLSLIVAILVYRRSQTIYEPEDSPIDALYDKAIVSPTIKLGETTVLLDEGVIDRLLHRFVYAQVVLAKIVGLTDRYIIDGAVKGTVRVTNGIGNITRSMIKGRIQAYLFWAVTGFVLLIFWFLK